MYNILLNLSVALPEKDAKEISDHIIKIYDTNHDGVVDFVEFMVVYLVMSKGSPDEILSTMFRVFDDDQNGKITIDEMRKLVESMYGMLVAENPELPDKRELARQMFREMDHNKDDVVTLEEFVASCKGQSEQSRLLVTRLSRLFLNEEVEEDEENPCPFLRPEGQLREAVKALSVPGSRESSPHRQPLQN